MARMYPNQLNPDTRSNAERMLYEALRDQLENDYVVFHSAAWLLQDKHGRPRDGEADFVIAHPQHGILVMEAKGGIIHFSSDTRQWSSTDPHGQTHDIKDPFGQAGYSKHALREHLDRKIQRPGRRINIGHAVAFPDVTVPETWLGPDKPYQIILDQVGLADLSAWVSQALNYWRGQTPQQDTVSGEEAVKAL